MRPDLVHQHPRNSRYVRFHGTIIRALAAFSTADDNYLALHFFVAAATQFAAGECVRPRLGRHDTDFHHFAFFQFPAVLAVGEGKAGRGAHFGAVGKRTDADSVRLVRGCNVQFDPLVNLHVDHGRLEIEILCGQTDNSGRLFTLRPRFLTWSIGVRNGESLR